MTAPYFSSDEVTLYHGDCLEVLRDLPDASVDAVVTDPPYGIAFMGKAWDQPGEFGSTSRRGGGPNLRRGRQDAALSPAAMLNFQRWCTAWAAECVRVLKPGGHLLSFGGSRTWHRLAVAVEDAGFEIRDSVAWLYGQGFPKSLDVAKAIAGAQCGYGSNSGAIRRATMGEDYIPSGVRGNRDGVTRRSDTGMAGRELALTPDAAAWQGWGTALKPAFEPIVVGRKPLIGTVAANVLAHRTGALNVDACRVQMSAEDREKFERGAEGWAATRKSMSVYGDYGNELSRPHDSGRWPTNVVLDEAMAGELDRQTGASRSRVGKPRSAGSGDGWGMTATGAEYDDAGGASRFFPTFRYEAKAPSSERPAYTRPGSGTGRVTGLGGKVRQCNVCETRAIESGASEPSCGHGDYRWAEPTADTDSRVAHPTVKPLNFMRWLVRLVTPPGGVVLEPFAGSGTTAEACVIEGFRCIAIEREADYLPLIVGRLTKGVQPVLTLTALDDEEVEG